MYFNTHIGMYIIENQQCVIIHRIANIIDGKIFKVLAIIGHDGYGDTVTTSHHLRKRS